MAKNNSSVFTYKSAPVVGAALALMGILILISIYSNISISKLMVVVILILTGLAFIKRLKLGIYGLLGLILFSSLDLINNLNREVSLVRSIPIDMIIYGILIVWFYPARDKFK